MASSTKIFTREEIEKVTTQPNFQDALIQGISDGFVAFHLGDFFAAPIQTLGAPPMAPFCAAINDKEEAYAAQTCVKSGYFRNNPFYVIKVASGGYPWENSGLMQVYSQATGRLQALLLDEGILTELRTAAVGALTTKLLAPRSIGRIGVMGTGVQARYQMQLIQGVVSCRALGVYGRSSDKLHAYQSEMQDQGWSVQCYDEPDDLLRQCDVVITTTSARYPVLGNVLFNNNDNLEDGGFPRDLKTRFIICIGADAPGKGEICAGLLNSAHVLVADNKEQSLARGEYQRLLPSKKDSIVPLGKVIHEMKHLMRKIDTVDDRLIVFDSSGVALQDCVVAQMVYEALTAKQASNA